MNLPEIPKRVVFLYPHGRRWQNGDGLYSNLRVHFSPGSLNAYRDGVSDPFFLGRPIVR